MKKTLTKVAETTERGGLHRSTKTPMGTNISENDKRAIEQSPVGTTVHGSHGDFKVTGKSKKQVALANTYEKHRG